jgi:putative transposase
MKYRQTNFSQGEFYHVYNRGNSKQIIYRNQDDFERFQKLLFLCNSKNNVSFRDADDLKAGVYSVEQVEPLVSIGAYCLMSNHFHILLTPLVEGGVGLFMQKISTAYVMYVNKRYKRKGGLFEGSFKSVHAETDRYLKYLFSYIHLNPTAKTPRSNLGEYTKLELDSLVNKVGTYSYSSLGDYLGREREEGLILDKEAFPDYFSSQTDLKTELGEWIVYGDE